MKIGRIVESTLDAVSHFAGNRLRSAVYLLAAVGSLVMPLAAQDKAAQPVQTSFPDTAAFIARVAEHQKEVESLLNQYTFTDKSTVYMLDKSGTVRSQHTDTYYITPTVYDVFTLHISHDGKPVSEANLRKQEEEIEHKLRSDERKAEKNPNARPRDALLFADIIQKSQFDPLRWENLEGKPTIAYSFAPKAKPARHGTNDEKIAGDLKGTMWINPEDVEVVRIEFSSVSPLSLGFLVNVKGFQGFVEQRKVNSEIWLPTRQDFVAQGHELMKGFRMRQVSEFSDFLKATTDVFQQVHSAGAVDGAKAPI